MIPHSKPFLNQQNVKALEHVLSTGMLTSGSLKNSFSRKLERVLGFDHVQVTSSGTMAFYKILLALGVSKEDEILLPDYICDSLLSPISIIGANAVLYDNDIDSWLTSVEYIKQKVSARTKVIIVNHTFGFIFKSVGVLREGLPEHIKIVEDCCHAITPRLNFGESGIGDNSMCSFFSFNATKYLATGEGGAIATNNSDLHIELNKINIGDNLSDISCSLGLSQLEMLDFFIDRRKEIALKYINRFADFIPKSADLSCSTFFRFPILVENNSSFWENRQVTYRKGVDSLLSDNLNCRSLKNARKVLECTVSIPIYPSLNDGDVQTIIDNTEQLLTDANRIT